MNKGVYIWDCQIREYLCFQCMYIMLFVYSTKALKKLPFAQL